MDLRHLVAMSHAVAPNDLSHVSAPYGSTPFLLYSAADGSARVNHVVSVVESAPAQAIITGFGRGVAGRIADGAAPSLLWPSPEPQGFSLIADGTGEIDGDRLIITITGAVLHRPAPVDGSTTC